MKKLTVFIALLIAAPTFASYEDGMKELHAKKVDSAYEILEEVSGDDARFVDAMEEIQKIQYAKQKWQKFFGYAVYYRQRFLSSRDSAQKHFNARMLNLEILALAKHCQWDAAKRVSRMAYQTAVELKHPGANEIKSTIHHLNLHENFPKANTALEKVKKPRVMFNTELFWQMKQKYVDIVSHPRNLRTVVESRCES